MKGSHRNLICDFLIIYKITFVSLENCIAMIIKILRKRFFLTKFTRRITSINGGIGDLKNSYAAFSRDT